MVPGIADRPTGCVFNPRCTFATDRCRAEQPALTGPAGVLARCHYPLVDGHPTNHPDPRFSINGGPERMHHVDGVQSKGRGAKGTGA
jgi:dipeptide transport system ATP-binding protein